MKIDISNFRTWKKDPITIALFKALEDVRKNIESGKIGRAHV